METLIRVIYIIIMPTFRQTNTITPTEDQFNELFDLRINTFWKYKAYSWFDPQLVYDSPTDMRNKVREELFEKSTFWQMFWEDDVLLGLRSFEPSTMYDASVPYVTIHSPFHKMFADDENWMYDTLKINIAISRPSPSIGDVTWAWTRPEVSPVWDNKDGETLYEAFRNTGFKRAYSTCYGSLQKQLLWNNRHQETVKYDIFLQGGYNFDESEEYSIATGDEIGQAGFDINDDETHIYRLIGGDSLGWPRYHALYHLNNAERPDTAPKPYIESEDSPDKPPVAPIPEPTSEV